MAANMGVRCRCLKADLHTYKYILTHTYIRIWSALTYGCEHGCEVQVFESGLEHGLLGVV